MAGLHSNDEQPGQNSTTLSDFFSSCLIFLSGRRSCTPRLMHRTSISLLTRANPNVSTRVMRRVWRGIPCSLPSRGVILNEVKDLLLLLAAGERQKGKKQILHFVQDDPFPCPLSVTSFGQIGMEFCTV